MINSVIDVFMAHNTEKTHRYCGFLTKFKMKQPLFVIMVCNMNLLLDVIMMCSITFQTKTLDLVYLMDYCKTSGCNPRCTQNLDQVAQLNANSVLIFVNN